jgi:uncharacterized damage-inducible protein DinB
MNERFLDLAEGYLDEYLRKIRVSLGHLSADQVWWRANPASNSAGNLVLHLCGNLSQWVLAGLAGEDVTRKRSEEFTAFRSMDKDALLARLDDVVARVRVVLRGLTPADLARARHVQGDDTDGAGVVFHVVEHMSYHTGQIVLLVKQLAGPSAEIEFYPQHRGE